VFSLKGQRNLLISGRTLPRLEQTGNISVNNLFFFCSARRWHSYIRVSAREFAKKNAAFFVKKAAPQKLLQIFGKV
jgi:hypothetical protein